MAPLHPAHAKARERLARALALYVEGNVMTGEALDTRRSPATLVLAREWDQAFRDSLARHAGQNPGFSDETWSRVIEILAERMAGRLGIEAIAVHAPKPCETCGGWGEVDVGVRHPYAHHPRDPRNSTVEAPCEDDRCLRGYEACHECGEAPAVLRLDGHRVWKGFEVCRSCARIPVARLLAGDVAPGSPDVVGSSPELVDSRRAS